MFKRNNKMDNTKGIKTSIENVWLKVKSRKITKLNLFNKTVSKTYFDSTFSFEKVNLNMIPYIFAIKIFFLPFICLYFYLLLFWRNINWIVIEMSMRMWD
jgi:hypothetical protein